MRTWTDRRGTPDLAEYGRILRRDPAELDAFLDRVTINVSHLWRHEDQFEVLRTGTLPRPVRAAERLLAVTLSMWLDWDRHDCFQPCSSGRAARAHRRGRLRPSPFPGSALPRRDPYRARTSCLRAVRRSGPSLCRPPRPSFTRRTPRPRLALARWSRRVSLRRTWCPANRRTRASAARRGARERRAGCGGRLRRHSRFETCPPPRRAHFSGPAADTTRRPWRAAALLDPSPWLAAALAGGADRSFGAEPSPIPSPAPPAAEFRALLGLRSVELFYRARGRRFPRRQGRHRGTPCR